MRGFIYPFRGSRSSIALLVGLLLLMGGSALHAQRWQETFGTTDPVGEEGNGVIQTASGDFVSAGVSTSGGSTQAYVVRTDPHGKLIWHYVYKIAGFSGSGANDVKEFANGDFGVVGWADMFGWRIAMVMRIDPNGVPVWTRAAWINNSGVILTSAMITQLGNGTTTFPDDIVFSGYTIPGIGTTVDGVLGRMDGSGNSIWVDDYELINSDDFLYGVEEVHVQAGQGSLGDIIGVGTSDNTGGWGQHDVWILRVVGNDGKAIASTLVGDGADEVGYAIRELRNGANPGDLAITGASNGRPAPSTADEAFVLQITGNQCDPNAIRAAKYYGDNGNDLDWGTSLAEITTVGTAGNIVIGGNTRMPGFGGQDGFMQEFQEGTLTPVGQHTYYGDAGDDEIHAIAEAPQAPFTTGYIFAGATNSSAMVKAGTGRNLWLGRNNSILENICDYAPGSASDASPSWMVTCITPAQKDDVIVAGYNATEVLPAWADFPICYSQFKPSLPEELPSMAPQSVTLAAYPIPAVEGERLRLAYTLAVPGVAEIVVTDALGRLRHRRRVECAAGGSAELVGTDGWSAGTYLARITVNGVSATTKIVLVGR